MVVPVKCIEELEMAKRASPVRGFMRTNDAYIELVRIMKEHRGFVCYDY
jgi:hypothetical protein